MLASRMEGIRRMQQLPGFLLERVENLHGGAVSGVAGAGGDKGLFPG